MLIYHPPLGKALTVNKLIKTLQLLSSDGCGGEEIFIAEGKADLRCVVENIILDEDEGKIILTWKPR